MLEHWVLRWNLMCYQKVDRLRSKFNNYGTFDLPLLERVKASAVAAGFADQYPEWQPVKLLERLPAFGLEAAELQLLPTLDAEHGEHTFGLVHGCTFIALQRYENNACVSGQAALWQCVLVSNASKGVTSEAALLICHACLCRDCRTCHGLGARRRA